MKLPSNPTESDIERLDLKFYFIAPNYIAVSYKKKKIWWWLAYRKEWIEEKERKE